MIKNNNFNLKSHVKHIKAGLPLLVMNIAVIPGKLNTDQSGKHDPFILELIFALARQQKSKKISIIANSNFSVSHSFPSNIELIDIGTAGKTPLLKNYWQEIKLPGGLKKIKADVLISFDGTFSRSASIPQILSVFGNENAKPGSIRKANIITVNSNWQREDLVSKYNVAKEKIEIISVAATGLYKPADESEKEKIKGDYSDGKEYFLCIGEHLKFDTFINLLKSYSHFKKRQQSSMKLLLLAKPDDISIKRLETYLHREDVVVIEKYSETEEAVFISSAYAVIIPENEGQTAQFTLKSMQSGVAILAGENKIVQEYAGESALYFDDKTEKDIGEKMIRIYTDEALRNKLILEGKKNAVNYTIERSADLLWACIIKAVK